MSDELEGAAGVFELDLRQRRMRAAVLTGRPDVADVAVRRGSDVAEEVVVRKRERRQRREVHRNDELRTRGQAAAHPNCHLFELYSPTVVPRPSCRPSGVAIAALMFGTFVTASLRQMPTTRADAVPETVQRVLDNVGCRRPQGTSVRTITRGHFVRASQDDWAALCISGQSSFIYVVWGGTVQCPSTLATKRNKATDAPAGFVRTLGTLGPDAIGTALQSEEKTRKIKIDHDGIEDAAGGSASTIHYCLNRSWVSLPRAD